MATRGYEHVTMADVQKRQVGPKPSKYRNVKVEINGERFDSKREAAYWQGLKAREKNGEIQDLHRQVKFMLLAPERLSSRFVLVAEYIADFTYIEADNLHVVDAKGKRTALYALKKKWLFLQDGIVVEEV